MYRTLFEQIDDDLFFWIKFTAFMKICIDETVKLTYFQFGSTYLV